MSTIQKIVWLAIVFVLAIGALASQVIEVNQAGFRHLDYTTNADELTRDVLVGQTITSTKNNLSAISVMFATYSGRNNTEPIKFHLRPSVYDGTDIRTATVYPDELGDNQLYQFEFDPIPDSQGKQYFFFVVSPDSTPGNAVTVDLDTRDPYHQGSAYVVRGQGSAVTNPAVLERSGKPTIDVSFGAYYSVPLREAVVDSTVGAVRTFIATWDEKKTGYWIWAQAIIPALLFFGVLMLVKQRVYERIVARVSKKTFTTFMLGILFIAALVTRYLYAKELPFTNDEGNYLYDAYAARLGVLAGGDGYVKAPLVVAWVALWQWLLGDTLLAGRISSVVIGALTMFPLYFLAKDLWSSAAITKDWVPTYLSKGEERRLNTGWGRRVGIVTAAIWAFFGAPVVFNIYVHTQPVALFLGISGLAVLLMALRGTTPRMTFLTTKSAPSAMGWFVFAGMLLGFGVASRKSILALGLIPLLFILTEGRGWKARGKHLVAVGTGFLVVIALFLGAAYYTYGQEGVWEAVGYNSAEDGIATDEDVTPEQIRAYSLGGMTPFFRESLPLILLSIIGLGVTLEQFVRSLFRYYLRRKPDASVSVYADHLVPKLAWIAPWLVFAWAWSFFFEYEGDAFKMQYGIEQMWYVFAGIIAFMTLMPRPKEEAVAAGKVEADTIVPKTKQPGQLESTSQTEDVAEAKQEQMSTRQYITVSLVIPLWIGGLAFFYMNWIKFHANYISEFIPPLVLLSAYGAIALYHRLQPGTFLAKDYPLLEIARRIGVFVLVLLLLWPIIVSNHITFFFEHTGTFSQSAIKEAAAWAKANIPRSEPIFTGAAMVPYLSGHRTALDIAHPRWYAYGFTRNDTERINTFLSPTEDMLKAYRNANWFMLEKQTGFSFLMEYSEIEAGLERDWVAVQGIENGSNTITFYRRVR